jgi:putative transposase
MNYNHDLHHRRSIRLKGYDYSIAGAYFITICTHQREHLFGDIIDGEISVNKLGNIAKLHWQQLQECHSHLKIDEYIVMPNHLHGIIILLDSSIDRPKSISEIIRGFKTFSARRINTIRKQRGIPVWQRDYFDRIIRTDEELDNVRRYIINNPQNWETDTDRQKI